MVGDRNQSQKYGAICCGGINAFLHHQSNLKEGLLLVQLLEQDPLCASDIGTFYPCS